MIGQGQISRNRTAERWILLIRFGNGKSEQRGIWRPGPTDFFELPTHEARDGKTEIRCTRMVAKGDDGDRQEHSVYARVGLSLQRASSLGLSTGARGARGDGHYVAKGAARMAYTRYK